MTNFKIGEKVVCVATLKAEEAEIILGVKMSLRNEMYTIREIIFDEGVYFRLEEIINPVLNYSCGRKELMFNSKHFRKLDYQFAEDVISNLLTVSV